MRIVVPKSCLQDAFSLLMTLLPVSLSCIVVVRASLEAGVYHLKAQESEQLSALSHRKNKSWRHNLRRKVSI